MKSSIKMVIQSESHSEYFGVEWMKGRKILRLKTTLPCYIEVLENGKCANELSQAILDNINRRNFPVIAAIYDLYTTILENSKLQINLGQRVPPPKH
jgi:hypothetical protein